MHLQMHYSTTHNHDVNLTYNLIQVGLRLKQGFLQWPKYVVLELCFGQPMFVDCNKHE
jgi:hypothetical protein